MPSDLDSTESDPPPSPLTSAEQVPSRSAGWLRMGVVAAASAVAGGLAAAWFYRKTLTRLQQAAEEGDSPEINTEPEDD